jgi:MoxR-like ATPase
MRNPDDKGDKVPPTIMQRKQVDLEKLAETSKKVLKSFEELNKVLIDRKAIIKQLLFALLTRNHLLLEGPPGVAKSFLADTVLGGFGDYFKVACTKKMTEDYLVGPLDMTRFREEGEYIHKIEGYLPTAKYAFLDEFLDLSTGALRALLEVLNERTFSRGPQRVRCPLMTAIAATNFSADSEESIEAVRDRFLFRAKVSRLTKQDDRVQMLMSTLADKKEVSLVEEDISYLRALVPKVEIPEIVVITFANVCGELKITDRTMVKALDVIRASAVLSGRTRCKVSDLSALDTCFSVPGEPGSNKQLSQAMSKFYAVGVKAEDAVETCEALTVRTSSLLTQARNCANYTQVFPVAKEAREALNLIATMPSAVPDKYCKDSAARCEAVLNIADKLYADENR